MTSVLFPFPAPLYPCAECIFSATDNPLFYNNRCYACQNGGCFGSDGCNNAEQRRIQNVVRVPASEYTQNLAGLNVYEKPLAKYANVNWNQMSDRAQPGVVRSNVSSHGNSTRHSITRMRPGSSSAAGQGVDMKHGSYDRYLNRLKGKGPYRTETKAAPAPIQGNKVLKYGIVNSYRYSSGCVCPA